MITIVLEMGSIWLKAFAETESCDGITPEPVPGPERVAAAGELSIAAVACRGRSSGRSGELSFSTAARRTKGGRNDSNGRRPVASFAFLSQERANGRSLRATVVLATVSAQYAQIAPPTACCARQTSTRTLRRPIPGVRSTGLCPSSRCRRRPTSFGPARRARTCEFTRSPRATRHSHVRERDGPLKRTPPRKKPPSTTAECECSNLTCSHRNRARKRTWRDVAKSHLEPTSSCRNSPGSAPRIPRRLPARERESRWKQYPIRRRISAVRSMVRTPPRRVFSRCRREVRVFLLLWYGCGGVLCCPHGFAAFRRPDRAGASRRVLEFPSEQQSHAALPRRLASNAGRVWLTRTLRETERRHNVSVRFNESPRFERKNLKVHHRHYGSKIVCVNAPKYVANSKRNVSQG